MFDQLVRVIHKVDKKSELVKLIECVCFFYCHYLGRPTVAPPRPPPTKPPPPPPTRSVSNQNLTNLPLSTVSATSKNSASSLTVNNINNNGDSSSFGSMASLKDALNQKLGGTGSFNNINSGTLSSSNGNVAPPLPPHRMCPAPPVQRQPSIVSFIIIFD